MTLAFIESHGFTEAVTEYFGSDDAYRQFQSSSSKISTVAR